MANKKTLDIATLESWPWEAARVIRGPLDAPKFKDYILPILPLIFLKRLSDVFDDEIGHLAHAFGSREDAGEFAEQSRDLVRFYAPPSARWPTNGEPLADLLVQYGIGIRRAAHGLLEAGDAEEASPLRKALDETTCEARR